MVEENEAELTPSPEETALVESITATNWMSRISAFQASIAGEAASFQVWLPSWSVCDGAPSSICKVMTVPSGQVLFSST